MAWMFRNILVFPRNYRNRNKSSGRNTHRDDNTQIIWSYKMTNSNRFNPNSARAVRGLNWENLLQQQLTAMGNPPIHVRNFFRQRGVDGYFDLCRYEHKYGDFMVKTEHKTIHFECVTVPLDKNGWFPEHKVQKYGNFEMAHLELDDATQHDYWFAFLITEDGRSGDSYFVHKNVIQSYMKKRPLKTYEGKHFRVYHRGLIEGLRASKSLEEVLYG